MKLKDVLKYIYPQRCPYCDEAVSPFGALICEEHKNSFKPVADPVCLKCGKELGDGSRELCYDCSQTRRAFDKNIAIFNYDSAAQESMVRFKYKGRREYADYYAQEIIRLKGDELSALKPQLIVPVPVHESRLKSRGYNQAGEIAGRLAAALGVPYRADVLIRARKTEAQKQLGAAGREANIASALSITADLSGICRILLVDDIYTTGSTLGACAKVLKAAGTKQVFCVTVCIGRDS